MRHLGLLSLLLTLVACGNNDNDNDNDFTTAPEPANASFEVSATNLTVAQPMSPLAVMIHANSQSVFSVGASASEELEVLAEGGDNSDLLDAISSIVAISGEAPLAPGASESFSLEIDGDDLTDMQVSVITMLVNTNDAFTGVNGADLSGLAIGDSMSFNTVSYDSGTEANTEQTDHIPGPVGGGEGEGFNSVRDDVRDQVTMHGGVVTADDGLSSSDLNQAHRWDNPVARITVTRTQ